MADKKHTTIGAGVRRETSDPKVAEGVAKLREQLGTGDAFRVEDLTPLQFLELQEAEAGKRLIAAAEGITAAHVAYGAAYEDHQIAQEKTEKARREAK